MIGKALTFAATNRLRQMIRGSSEEKKRPMCDSSRSNSIERISARPASNVSALEDVHWLFRVEARCSFAGGFGIVECHIRVAQKIGALVAVD